jgi:tetratricopeptide (TPR) repeat protein
MTAFSRAAALFDRLLAMPADQRAAELDREADEEVRDLVRAMLAGEDDPVHGLESGLPGVGALIGDALDDSSDISGSGDASEATAFELAGGPYRVLGVLARGGMGVVLRGHDEELGRDVAIKVLRAGSRDAANARLRFVEEAQVAGQLEHPGIVPIYHLGTDDAGRPFFAMKLVEGETLASRLDERTGSHDGRGRFLALLLQVCQTVAYAHARRVIHRDLKPANVMIGAFGEVQVLDWGLAKVLGTPDRVPQADGEARAAPETVRTDSGSASVTGTVMGTPRYMPPEQALGEVERLDRRSDVFSLGAILCEILTGEPPFTGEREAAMQAAREAQLEPAFERLERCGADPALIALARRALAPLPADRPADAGELATEIERSLTAVEERAHAAELAAEAARASAQSERRAKRMTLAFTVSAAVFAVILIGVFQWRALERTRDALRSSEDVDAALNVASERFAVAQAASPEDEAAWDATQLALETAENLASDRELTDEVAEKLEHLRAAFTPARESARNAARQLRMDNALVDALEEIRAPTRDGADPYDYPRMRAQYEAVFEVYGIDFDNEVQALEKLRASAIAEQLAAALDHWALCNQVLSERGMQDRLLDTNRLLRLAIETDPDWDRRWVREGLINQDLESLRALDPFEDRFGPEAIDLLSVGFRILGDDEAAAELLLTAAQQYPGDYWLNLHLALVLRATSPDGLSESALEYFRAALGARPESNAARHLLGSDLVRLGRIQEARTLFEELTDRDRENGHLLAHLGECIVLQEGREAARETLSRAVEYSPYDSYALSWYGRTLEVTDSAWEAVVPLRLAYEIEPNAMAAGHLGGALSAAGDNLAAYDIYRAGMSFDPDNWNLLYNAGTIARELGDTDRAEQLLLRCTEVRPEFAEARCNLAWVYVDVGRFDEALATFGSCHQLGRNSPRWVYPSEAWIAYVQRAQRFASELDSLMTGGFDPREPLATEQAEVARALGYTRTASDWFERVAELAGGLSSSDLDLAALSAASASSGSGKDAEQLSSDERARQATMALDRLEVLRERLMDDFRSNRYMRLAPMRAWLQSWTVHPAYAGLRDPLSIDLPNSVRERSRTFWRALDADLREISDWCDDNH